jgi:hypothetical protein
MSSLKSGQSAIEDNGEKTVITASDACQSIENLVSARVPPSGALVGLRQGIDHIKISLYV